jgi:peptidoglycan/LPS O-acetylase OafA/YrhL
VPEPVGRGQRYMPGLDGLRALAVAAVIAYHLNMPWAPGGLLGVGVFFTLSGYLITDLLLGSWHTTNNLQLRDFWLRRARRLLPALFVMLAAVTIWVALADRSQLGALRGDVFAASAYVSNWWLALQHVSYFARFGPPSPLGHLWSLAVEEQFYLIWPWLLLAGLIWLGRRRLREQHKYPGLDRGVTNLLPLAVVTLVLAALSAGEMALLYQPSFDPSRVYDGTDTRAFGLLFGAALAMVWPSRALRPKVTPGARRLIDGIGILGLIGIFLLIGLTNQYSPFLYRGGLVLLSLATVLVVASATHPASRMGRLLGVRPLRWTGVRSYGIYLWHYPVIVLTTATVAAHTDLGRDALQVGATVVLADLSWRLIETPIRHGALGRTLAEAKSFSWRLKAFPRATKVAFCSVPGVLLIACLGLAGLIPAVPSGTLAVASAPASSQLLTQNTELVGTAAPTTVTPTTGGPTTEAPTTTAPNAGSRGGVSGSSVVTSTTLPAVASGTTSAVPPGSSAALATSTSALQTSCKQVAHLGDSTSESLIESDYLPVASQRLQAQYARVGVARSLMEIVGANSIVETLPGDENGYEIAQGLVRDGYRGCWVIALGTNDTADVYVGSNVSLATRIQRMMSVIGNEPVLWVNVKTLLDSGPYSEANMEDWDNALLAACPDYPNMRVFNWAAMAQTGWFTTDGIHYTSDGSAPRAAAIADALATAFPATTNSAQERVRADRKVHNTQSSCVVNGTPSWHLPSFQY